MKLYKITAQADEKKVKWVGTQADASTTRKAFAEDGFSRKEISTAEIDVPTDKAGLLTWLNDNVKE